VDERDTLLAAADRIARRLCRDAIWSGDRCTWLGWSPRLRTSREAVYEPLGASVYDGTAGIAWFLGHAAALTGDPVFRWCYDGAVRQTLARSSPRALTSLYAGSAGIALMLVETGSALGDGAAVERGLRLFDEVAAAPPDGAGDDVIGGLAGAVGALLRAGERCGVPALVRAAERFGDALVARARPQPVGSAWPRSHAPELQPLCGYGHGASGVAAALAQLYRAVPNGAYAAAANAALAYERSLFDAAHGNWPDLRADGAFNAGWCNGASGSGFARLLVRRALGGGLVDDELDAAVAVCTAAAGAPDANQCICHGGCGVVEFLYDAARELDRPALRQRALDLAAAAASLELDDRTWPCGPPDQREKPGLFTGLAGIGYSLLRCAASGVPSVLAVGLSTPDRARDSRPAAP
jgi:lantibiotic modifying enzyme